MDAYMKDLLKDVLIIFDGLFEGAFIVDRERKILYWNKVAKELNETPSTCLRGKYCFESGLQPFNEKLEKLCDVDCPVIKVFHDGKPREKRVYFRHKNGSIMPTLMKTFPLRNQKGEVVAAVEIFNETTESRIKKNEINELNKLVLTDPLTQLFNRRGIEEHLKIRLKEYKNKKIYFGVVFLDIDKFKQINDNFGHNIGDLVLKEIGKALIKNFRKKDIIGRWGGDEFIGIFSEISEKKLKNISKELECLIQNLDIDYKDIKITLSIGYTMASSNDTTVSIIKRVDEIMYLKKLSKEIKNKNI